MKHDWEYKKLGEVCDVQNGFAFKSQLFKNEGNPILRISNIQNGVIVEDDTVFFTPDDYDVDFERYIVKKDDIVIAMSGATTGKVGINKTEHRFYLNQRVGLFRENKEKIQHLYLYFFLQTQAQDALRMAEGLAQPNLSTGQIKDFIIPVPPLPTQQSIVSELDSLSKIIADCKETLKDYDALEQSIFYDMFGDPVKNDKGWDVKKLGEVCTFKNGVNFSKNDKGKQYKFVGVSDFLDKKELHARDLDSVLIEETVSSEYHLNEGDIVFVRSNGSKSLVGRNVLVHTEDEIVLFSGFCIRARIHDENMTPLFLLHTLKADSVKCLISNSGRGCNISNLNQKILDSINVIIPSLPLQNQFIGKISAIENMKSETKKALQEAETLFNARMDYWFN